MTGGNEGELSFSKEMIAGASVVFDVVAKPVETPLVLVARDAGKEVLTGFEIMALQAAIQFKLYTGIELTEDQIKRAAEFSRLPI
jgi:shikimate dehydrogenase